MKGIEDIHHDMVILKGAFGLFRDADLNGHFEGVICTVDLLGEKVGALCDELEVWITKNEK